MIYKYRSRLKLSWTKERKVNGYICKTWEPNMGIIQSYHENDIQAKTSPPGQATPQHICVKRNFTGPSEQKCHKIRTKSDSKNSATKVCHERNTNV